MVTIAERTNRFYLVKKVQNKILKRYLMPLWNYFVLMRLLNCLEFVAHKAKALGADFYLAHPYSSWERGLNKNFNGLLANTSRRGQTYEQ